MQQNLMKYAINAVGVPAPMGPYSQGTTAGRLVFVTGQIAVSADDIVSAVEAAGGPKLDKRIVVLPEGLVKKTGNYQVELKLHADVLGKVNFSVRSLRA